MSETAASAPSYEDGLLSLSLAAASATPIVISREPSQDSSSFMPGNFNGPSSLTSGSSTIKPHPLHKHRRLSSTGQARRRLSDAREATSRPSAVTIQTAAAALSSLATLSLSASPPPQGISKTSPFVSVPGHVQSAPSQLVPIAPNGTEVEAHDDDLDLGDAFDSGQVKTEINGPGISVTSSKSANGKKRGTIFKCESCSKVYRHPSCLIKHRWEHSPHWREASKFLLSKHQQVQLLEAAAILSHLSPSARGGTSLPEDRSLWPSYLSGGLLPPPNTANTSSGPAANPALLTSSSVPANSVLSSSVRPLSAGSRPRMHHYAISDAGGITHFRPGVVGVPTGPSASPEPEHVSTGQRSVPVPVPRTDSAYREQGMGFSFVSGLSDVWSSPVSVGFAQSSFRSSSVSMSASEVVQSYSGSTGGWSLPRSSVRSGSRSRSGSASESDFVDVDGDEELGGRRFGFTSRSWKRDEPYSRSVSVGQDKIEEEWDGMEMEMEM
ncbi:hypothetical protein BKA93DRAFT_802345 [Sparassis latifolia]|uniref:C2H2-type domain-containing protein n=1 Tax=Sparassis crispa TaxID=139825 RepID=A0A401GPY4_9APHY|nr:hypothetical protein SCP_0602560 [Sparassis crispa]GBE84278.1 hypothetical protein SCP_0602560 [Sparassis crispa]